MQTKRWSAVEQAEHLLLDALLGLCESTKPSVMVGLGLAVGDHDDAHAHDDDARDVRVCHDAQVRDDDGVHHQWREQKEDHRKVVIRI